MPKTRYLDPTASPRKAKEMMPMDFKPSSNRLNIEEHFFNSQCLVCGSPTSEGLCDDCYFFPEETIAILLGRIQANDMRLIKTQQICTTCTGTMLGEPVQCESLDCPWFFSRKRADNEQEFMMIVQEILEDVVNAKMEESVYSTTDNEESGNSEDDDYMDFLFQTPEN
ncbi:hypothetical protein H0H81_009715 [Sphagnurus paluster]|uniref:C4-type zinc-finger of DNA polymerase delta domain-containing protein n=1 Tax=Sphagnurus paluster TaxID=117069 RepID=A0A9P7GJE2_9AGAR|nr:hypothetical protein H0H81_009715 [Sphagnurus paluster]